MVNQEDLISKFKDVTGSSDERARFFLESSNWGLQVALSSFYESQSEPSITDSDQQTSDSVDIEREYNIPPSGRINSSASGASLTNFVSDFDNLSNPPSKTNSNQKKMSNKPRIATLHNMSQRSSDDEEEGQAFYAGGSERSGQQVLGPPKRKNFREQLTEMFRMAHESGAVIDPSSNNQSTASTSRSSLYQGAGLRLGQTEDDHSVVGGAERPARPQNIEPVILKLWSQGFSINDGDLRSYEDPENSEFLETVLRGQIPNELRKMGTMVSVDLEDHRHEDFKKPSTSKVKTFKGSGHTLGSPAPKVEGTIPPQASGSGGGSNNEENEKKATEKLNLNTEQSTTMLQIRLADGSRLSGRFNLTHTVEDIRRYIITARPQYEFQNFILVTAFPTKELTDGTKTIEEAGLSNASLMQRLK